MNLIHYICWFLRERERERGEIKEECKSFQAVHQLRGSFRVNAFCFKEEVDLFLTFGKCQIFSLFLPSKLMQCMNS